MRAAAKERDGLERCGTGALEDSWRSTKKSAERTAIISGMPNRAIVLDANILIRAVLGMRIREIQAEDVSFLVPETAYAEAEEHLAALIAKRAGDPAKGGGSFFGRPPLWVPSLTTRFYRELSKPRHGNGSALETLLLLPVAVMIETRSWMKLHRMDS